MVKKIRFEALALAGIISFIIPGRCFAESLEQAKGNVYSLIEAGKYAEAQVATKKLERDFAGDEGLAEAKYRIAERFERNSGFAEAKAVYQEVIQNNPQGQWAGRAKLGAAGAEIKETIMAGDYRGALEKVDTLAADFSAEPAVGETIYWIAERFERLDGFEEAKQTYQRIIRDFPGGAFGDKAKFGLAKLSAMASIVAQDYEGAKVKVKAFIDTFGSDPNFPWAFYWLTERYDRQNRREEAKAGFELITTKFPNSTSAGGARLRLAKLEAISLVEAKDYNKADEALYKMIRDFSGHREIGFAVLRVGEEYFRQKGLAGAVEKAKNVFKIVADGLPVTSATPEACVWAADAARELGQYEEAIGYYNRAREEYPQYAFESNTGYRQKSLFMTGQCYQKIARCGDAAGDEATSKAREAYERLVQEAGDSGFAKDAWRELGFLYAGKGNHQETARCLEQYRRLVADERCPKDVFYGLAKAYDAMGEVESAKTNYERFIRMALLGDQRRKEAMQRLTELKAIN